MKVELERCPFCIAGLAGMRRVRHPEGIGYRVRCGGCGASTGVYPARWAAAHAWNWPTARRRAAERAKDHHCGEHVRLMRQLAALKGGDA